MLSPKFGLDVVIGLQGDPQPTSRFALAHRRRLESTGRPPGAAAQGSIDVAAVSKLDIAAVKKDIRALITTSQPFWPAGA